MAKATKRTVGENDKSSRKSSPTNTPSMARGKSSVRRFSPLDYAKLWQRSKAEIIAELVERGLVKNYVRRELLPTTAQELKPSSKKIGSLAEKIDLLFKEVFGEGSNIDRPNPPTNLVKIIARKNAAGGVYFYIRKRGGVLRSTKIQVDIRPVPTLAAIEANPLWWEESARRDEIAKQLLKSMWELIKTPLEELLAITKSDMATPDHLIGMHFANILSLGGFQSSPIWTEIVQAIGNDRWTKLLHETCRLTSSEISERAAEGWLTVRENARESMQGETGNRAQSVSTVP